MALADESCDQTGLLLHVGYGQITGIRFLESKPMNAASAGTTDWLLSLEVFEDFKEATSATHASIRVARGGRSRG